MELKRILQIILRRKWIAIQAFLIISLTAIIGTYFLTPVYETSAKLWFKPPTVTPSILASIGMKEITSFVPYEPKELDIGTKVTLTKVYPLLEKVIFKLQIRDEEGILVTPDKLLKSSLLYILFPAPSISVQQDTNSNTVTITTRSPDPTQAMFISNALAEAYIEDSENERRRETQSARSFIDGQIVKVKEDYNKALKDMLTFQDTYKTVNLEIETRIAIEKMAELMKQKEDNIIDISQTREKIKVLKAQLQQSPESVPTMILKENPQIQSIMQEITQLRSKLAGELTDKTEYHPDVILLKQQIKELETELEKEVKTHQTTSPELSEMERQLAALEVHLEGVNKDIAKYTNLIKTLPVKTAEEAKLKLALTASQDIYSSLLDYSNRIGVAEAMTLPDALLVQPATRPYEPKSPNLVLNGIIGIFVGFIFALGLAFITEYVDDTIKTSEDIGRYKDLTFLGSVPQIKGQKLISALDVNDPISEAYRAIRYGIKYASPDKAVKSFVITSSRPKEGKTLTVANLGISFSQTGLKVIIVDTDLRRPYLNDLFEKPNQLGLTSAITGECTLEDAITDTGIEGLSLLPSGPTPPDPNRIYESERLKEFIMFLKKKYDMVIFDSAPVLIKSDATVLGRYVDGVIYTIEAEKTTRGDVAETIDVLKRADVKLIGAILNRYGRRKKSTYYKKARIRRKIFGKAVLSMFIVLSLVSGCSDLPFKTDIKQYLSDLKSSNVIIKRDAIYKLGKLKEKEAVPELINLLNKDAGELAPFIIEALGNIGDNTALRPIITMLDSEDTLTRVKAIEALGKIKDKRAIPALIPVLEQKDNRTEAEVFTAIWALGNIGDKSAEPALNALLGDNNKYVRYNVEQALKKIRDTSTKTAENSFLQFSRYLF
ncbi:MAG: polysaccharide biosynthesis tyrosine autokinase [Thermodesulfovibrionales bacterium]